MKRRSFLLAGASLGLLSSGCSSLVGPRSIELPLAQIQAALGRRMPLENRYLGLFDVRLENPRLSLAGGRLGLNLDAGVKPIFGNTFHGSLGLSGVPRLDLEKNAVLLGQVQLDRLALDGMPAGAGDQLTRLGNALAQRFASDVPIYSFNPSQFELAGMRFQPTNINTSAQGLVISFAPVR